MLAAMFGKPAKNRHNKVDKVEARPLASQMLQNCQETSLYHHKIYVHTTEDT